MAVAVASRQAALSAAEIDHLDLALRLVQTDDADELTHELHERFPSVHHEPPTPLRGTSALPGTEEKIRVMAARLERREKIFHPADVRPENIMSAGPRAETGRNGQKPGDRPLVMEGRR